jgi:hypothetical protein
VKLRRLLWFDCLAAAVAGTAMLALGGRLAPLLGLPRGVLLFIALVNLAYGAFSFSLARRPMAPAALVKVLVAANLSWVVVCVGMAIHFAGPESRLGAALMAGEGIFVGTLAVIEGRVLAASLRR